MTISYTIYFQSNRITVIKGLSELTSLQELYLDHNGVEVIEGLDNNVSILLQISDVLTVATVQVNLLTLDLASNRISRLSNLSHLTKLEEFWVKTQNINQCLSQYFL